MRAYVQALQSKGIFALIHHTLVVAKIFSPFGLRQTKVRKSNQNGDKTMNNKKKNCPKGQCNGSNMLSPKELEHY